MRITEQPDRLAVADTPGCLWLLGLWFAAGGVLALSMPFIAVNRAALPWWGTVLLLGLGLAHLGVGLYTVGAHPATRTEFDRASGQGRVVVRGLGRRARVETFALADVCALEARPGRDGDGDPTVVVRLWLRGGRVVRLHAHPLAGTDWAGGHAARVYAFLGLPAPPE